MITVTIHMHKPGSNAILRISGTRQDVHAEVYSLESQGWLYTDKKTYDQKKRELRQNPEPLKDRFYDDDRTEVESRL
jgi:hypothetical protein